MVTLFTAALAWENACAKDLLTKTMGRYRQATTFGCRLNYDCTKTSIGQSEEPGTSDFLDLRFDRRGSVYSVKPIASINNRVFRAGQTMTGMDPYLVYDNRLTFWLGLRGTDLSRRLIPRDSSGPFYSLFAVNRRKVAVYETYLSQELPAYEVTYVIDPAEEMLLSVSTCGVLSGTGDGADQAHPRRILWSESIELTDQSFSQ